MKVEMIHLILFSYIQIAVDLQDFFIFMATWLNCNKGIRNEELKNREFDCWLWNSFYYFKLELLYVLAHKIFLECAVLRHQAGHRQDIQIRIILSNFFLTSLLEYNCFTMVC